MGMLVIVMFFRIQNKWNGPQHRQNPRGKTWFSLLSNRHWKINLSFQQGNNHLFLKIFYYVANIVLIGTMFDKGGGLHQDGCPSFFVVVMWRSVLSDWLKVKLSATEWQGILHVEMFGLSVPARYATCGVFCCCSSKRRNGLLLYSYCTL